MHPKHILSPVHLAVSLPCSRCTGPQVGSMLAETTMKLSTLAVALMGATLFAGTAQAQIVAALVGDQTIAFVDVAALKADRSVKVEGIPGKLLGIDVRPADGMLYGLVSDGTVVTIDTKSGQAMQKAKLDAMTRPAALEDLPGLAGRILGGGVQGRVVVDV